MEEQFIICLELVLSTQILLDGGQTAYEQGWFSPEEAIIGGAKWISVGILIQIINKIPYIK